jgi:hypothetical protein
MAAIGGSRWLCLDLDRDCVGSKQGAAAGGRDRQAEVPQSQHHANAQVRVREVVRCHVWVGRTKGAMIDGGSTFRRPCSALLPG